MEFGKINVENICKENDERIERVRKIMDEKNIPFSEAVMLEFQERIKNDLRKFHFPIIPRAVGKNELMQKLLNYETKTIPDDEINPDKTYKIECGSRSWLVPGAVLIELEKHFG